MCTGLLIVLLLYKMRYINLSFLAEAREKNTVVEGGLEGAVNVRQ